MCCISKNEDKRENPIRVTDLAKRKLFFTGFLTYFVF